MIKFRPLIIYKESGPEPPPSLPPYTIRVKFTEGIMPTFEYGTGVQVSSSPNVWDLTYENSNWYQLLYMQSNLIEVIGANTTGVTNMGGMLGYCPSLVRVPLFDTSLVTSMNGMFNSCSSLTNIPLFDTSSVTTISYAFTNCVNVQSGALALYQQVSSQASVPHFHDSTFHNCGSNTTTGAAELAQIPSEWK